MKKLIKLFAVVACLLSGMSAFSQVVVSGTALDEPITYESIELMKKDYKKLKNAAKKGLTVTFPINSTLRDEQNFKAVYENVFNEKSMPWKDYNGNDFDWNKVYASYTNEKYFTRAITISDCINYSYKEIYISFYNIRKAYLFAECNLLTPQTYGEKMIAMENERKLNQEQGYGYITNAELEKKRRENEKLENERKLNQEQGYGYITNAEKKAIITQRKKEEEEAEKKKQEIGNYYIAKKQYFYAEIFGGVKSPLYWSEKEHDPFEIHDAQIAYYKDRARYLSEYPGFEIYIRKDFGGLHREEIDYEKRTANYSLSLTCVNKVPEQIADSWIGLFPSKTGITLKNLPAKEDLNTIIPSVKEKLIPEVKKLYDEEKIALFVLIGSEYDSWGSRNTFGEAKLPLGGSIPEIRTVNGVNYFSSVSKYKTSLYEIKLGLYDKNGNLIQEGTRQELEGYDRNNNYQFNDISAENMQKIENEDYTIKILGLWMKYGVVDIRSDKSVAYGKIDMDKMFKNLPEIQFDLNKVTFEDWTPEIDKKYSGWGK